MLTRNELIFKWGLYSAAAWLCVVVQGLLLQRIRVAGVLPFIFPLLAAVPATFEAPVAATTFALGVGVACDWLLPGSCPCLYTLLFPLIGLAASLVSKGLLPAGPLCSLAVSVPALLSHGGAQCLLLWIGGHAAWETGASVAVREAAVTLPLCLPLTFLFRWVRDHTHLDD